MNIPRPTRHMKPMSDALSLALQDLLSNDSENNDVDGFLYDLCSYAQDISYNMDDDAGSDSAFVDGFFYALGLADNYSIKAELCNQYKHKVAFYFTVPNAESEDYIRRQLVEALDDHLKSTPASELLTSPNSLLRSVGEFRKSKK